MEKWLFESWAFSKITLNETYFHWEEKHILKIWEEKHILKTEPKAWPIQMKKYFFIVIPVHDLMRVQSQGMAKAGGHHTWREVAVLGTQQLVVPPAHTQVTAYILGLPWVHTMGTMGAHNTHKWRHIYWVYLDYGCTQQTWVHTTDMGAHNRHGWTQQIRVHTTDTGAHNRYGCT